MPEIDRKISLGHIVQLLTFVVLFAIGYSRINEATIASAATLIDHETRIRTLESTVTGALARIDERLGNIERGLK